MTKNLLPIFITLIIFGCNSEKINSPSQTKSSNLSSNPDTKYIYNKSEPINLVVGEKYSTNIFYFFSPPLLKIGTKYVYTVTEPITGYDFSAEIVDIQENYYTEHFIGPGIDKTETSINYKNNNTLVTAFINKYEGSEDIKVPAGNFTSCAKVVTSDTYTGITTTYWLAKNVGIVKSRKISTDKTYIPTTIELKYFKL